jgi:O-antigen ligase
MSISFSGIQFESAPERIVSRAATRAGNRLRYGALIVGAPAVAFLPPLYGVLLVIGVAAALFLLTKPFGALCTLAFSVPFESVRNIQLGGLNVTITNLIVFCVALGWLTRCVTEGEIRIGPTPWRAALLVYGAVLLLSVTQAIDFVGSFKELLKWGQLLFVYLAGISIVRTREQVRTLLIVLFAAVMSEALVGVIQIGLHSGPSSFARGGLLRAAGTFAQPNPFAGYLNMTLPLAVACLVCGVFPRRYMWIVTIVTVGGVVSSLSRGGELGTAAALITFGIMLSPNARGLLAAGAVGVIGLLILVAVGVVPSTITEPIAQGLGIANVDVVNPDGATWNIAERLAHMQAGLGMYQDRPILGVGIGNYPAQYVHYKVQTPSDVWHESLGHAHNYYINIAAEAGTFGLIAFGVLLVSACVICYRSYTRNTDPLSRAIGLGGLGVMVAFAFHMFFDDLFVHGMEVQIALVMVLVSVSAYLGDDRATRTAVTPT